MPVLAMILVAFVAPNVKVVPTLSKEFDVNIPKTSKEVVIVAVIA